MATTEARPATAADLPDVLRLARRMWAESPRWRGQPYDADRIAGMAVRLAEAGLLAVHGQPVVAFAAAVVAQDPYTGVLVAQDVAAYVAPEARGRGLSRLLMGALEGWARERGATRFYMTLGTDIDPAGAQAAYAAQGYTLAGVTMEKNLLPA